MKLSNMRFKGFVWPHNPRVYTIEYRREMAVHKVPFGRYHLQSLGLTRRVMKGEGEFVGADAYDQFKRLATVFYEDTAGILVHPLWDVTSAWFVGLELEEEPKADYVRYRFEFWEDHTGYATTARTGTAGTQVGQSGTEETDVSAGPVYHAVVQGETLWGIASSRGLTLDQLVALNPQIKNPNLITVGQKVRVA